MYEREINRIVAFPYFQLYDINNDIEQQINLTLTSSNQTCGVSTAESSASINGRELCILLP